MDVPIRSVGMRTRVRLLAIGTTLVLAAPAVAQAAWTQTNVMQGRCAAKTTFECSTEPAPRVAINADGLSVTTWVDAKGRIRAVTASARGKLTKGATLDTGYRPVGAISTNGTATVVWSHRGELRYARREPGHNFTKVRRLVARGSKNGDDSPKLAAQPDGSTVVVYENSYRDSKGRFMQRLRSVVLSRGGRVSALKALGKGSFGRDSFRTAPSGRIVVCCLRDPVAVPTTSGAFVDAPRRATVLEYTPGSGWSALRPPLGQRGQIETVALGDRDVAVGVTDARLGGESNTFGVPQLLRADSQGAFGPPFVAPVANERKAFDPVVAIDGSGRNVLLFQEKTGVSSFSSSAPLYAVVGTEGDMTARRRTLDGGRAYQPALAPLGSGAIAAWQSRDNKWRVAIERGGVFDAAAAPSGLGPSIVGEDFHYNRNMATHGRYVVLAWVAKDASVRMSVGKF